jgi:sterol desaturase/sphingolipid hydroxylase (fatty acid hydroxylase superfamily)
MLETALPLDLERWFAWFQIGGAVVLSFAVATELFLRVTEGKRAVPEDGWANAALFLVGPVLEGIVGNAILLAGLVLVFELTPLRIPVSPLTLVLYFLAGELCFYWFHRVGHQVRIFWADHSIHHSSPELDFTVNLRHTPLSSLYRLLTFAPVVALGFHPVVLALFAMVSPSFQTFCHTDRIGRLAPWFERHFVTPSNHAVHHACNAPYLDKNYGGLLMLWDHVFGTYQRLLDEVPPVFGTTKPVASANPLRIVAFEFRNLWRDVRAAESAGAKVRTLLGPPGAK